MSSLRRLSPGRSLPQGFQPLLHFLIPRLALQREAEGAAGCREIAPLLVEASQPEERLGPLGTFIGEFLEEGKGRVHVSSDEVDASFVVESGPGVGLDGQRGGEPGFGLCQFALLVQQEPQGGVGIEPP